MWENIFWQTLNAKLGSWHWGCAARTGQKITSVAKRRHSFNITNRMCTNFSQLPVKCLNCSGEKKWVNYEKIWKSSICKVSNASTSRVGWKLVRSGKRMTKNWHRPRLWMRYPYGSQNVFFGFYTFLISTSFLTVAKQCLAYCCKWSRQAHLSESRHEHLMMNLKARNPNAKKYKYLNSYDFYSKNPILKYHT